jgi:restriction endonuclease Mrr
VGDNWGHRRSIEKASSRSRVLTALVLSECKEILVTTSGYGQASFDFAQNKPIELIDGANLLYLLSEHAGIEAKIMPPDDWKDPAADAR